MIWEYAASPEDSSVKLRRTSLSLFQVAVFALVGCLSFDQVLELADMDGQPFHNVDMHYR